MKVATQNRTTSMLAAFAFGIFSVADARACEYPRMPIARDSGSVLLLASAGASISPAGARRFEVRDSRAGATTIARGPAVFVPWAHRSDCKPVPLPADHPWSPPASPAVYMVVPRARPDWIGGVRTFDVFVAQREPLWYEGIKYYGWFGTATSMTPAEFLTFYAAFPTIQELQAKSPAIERRIAAWEAAHSATAAHEPALTMLAALRRSLAAR